MQETKSAEPKIDKFQWTKSHASIKSNPFLQWYSGIDYRTVIRVIIHDSVIPFCLDAI